VGALIAAGVIAFFTGGAGLLVAVDIVMKALILIFGAIAVYRASGQIWEYVKQAWKGDATAAGKALAKAFAIIVVEFFLDKILLGMSRVFKRIIKAVKVTKVGRAIRIGVIVVKKGLRPVKRLIKKGIAKIAGSKLVVSMRGIVGKGSKKLSDLRNKILDRFGFKKIWLEKHGKWIELWGSFNAKVLLSKGEIIDVDDAGPVGKRGTFVDKAGKNRRGIVVDRTGNEFSRALDELDDAARRQEYLKLNKLDDIAERSARIQVGAETAKNARILRSNLEGMSAGKQAVRGYPPKAGDAAHHMVPSTHGFDSAVEARKILDDVGVDINHGLNGVYLSPDLHGPLHTQKYMDEVLRRLERVSSLPEAGRKAAASAILDKIASDILAGKFPY